MSSTSKQQQSSSTTWKFPKLTSQEQLRLFNHFTKKKEIFIPINGNEVRWYICGPSLYDTNRLDHARFYMSLDILRRVMQDYFAYDIIYFLNINDSDHKIVEFIREPNLMIGSNNRKKVLEDGQLPFENVEDDSSRVIRKDKRPSLDKQGASANDSIGNMNSLSTRKFEPKKSFDDDGDSLPSYSKSLFSFSTTSPHHNKRFFEHGRYLEEEFRKNMEMLSILPPNIGARTSDYVIETIKFIEKIFENGYAYEAKSSVYFDSLKFRQHYPYEEHQPERIAAVASSIEGENETEGKKNESDFILWKRSGPDEPVWQSPWGLGHPPSNIQCGVVASEILNSEFDIHSGYIDQNNRHHHNEIDQFLLNYMNKSWVKYLVHVNGLTIDGRDMTPSSNNIISIEQAIEKFSSQQIRLLFLLHPWSTTFDLNEEAMKKASNYEQIIIDDFNKIKKCLSFMEQCKPFDAYAKLSEHDRILIKHFSEIKKKIHLAFTDSIDTPTILENIHELISTTNIYVNVPNLNLNGPLLKNLVEYITRLLTIFGLDFAASSSDDS